MTSDKVLTVSEQELRAIGAAIEPDALAMVYNLVALEGLGAAHLAMTTDVLDEWIDKVVHPLLTDDD